MKQCFAAVVWFFMLAGAGSAQTLTGSAAVSGITGYQTNPYLDPMLNEWVSSYPRTFMTVVPRGGLVWSTERSRIGVQLTGRLDEHPGRRISSSLVRGSGYGSYELSSNWEVGGQGGWRKLTYYNHSTGSWALPYVRWNPSPDARVDLQVGWTGRTSRDSLGYSSSYNSGFGVLQGHYWATSRLQLDAGVHLSDSRAVSGSMRFGGSGINAGLTYWMRNDLSVSVRTGVQYLRYEMETLQDRETASPRASSDPITWQDLLLRGSGEVRWQALPHLTVFGRGRLMQANHSFAREGRFDTHVSAGMTVRFDGPLIRWSDRTSRSSRWHKTEDGMELQIVYPGEGQLFITGDFNDWASPGRPLRPVGEDRYAVKLSLPPGRYQYSIRVINEDGECWLDLPAGLRTVNDGFGNENGVVVVY